MNRSLQDKYVMNILNWSVVLTIFEYMYWMCVSVLIHNLHMLGKHLQELMDDGEIELSCSQSAEPYQKNLECFLGNKNINRKIIYC